MTKLKLKLQHQVFIALIIGACYFSNAQTNKCKFLFSPTFGNSALFLDTYYPIALNDSLQITTLKFYISAIELWQDEKLVWKEKTQYHLVDVSEASSLNFFLEFDKLINFNNIKFNLGVDSVTNVSGALGGALDPTRGMYWTWQSGYINLKLEGNTNLCKARHNEFVFHLGGYQKPFLGVQHLKLETNHKEEIKITMDIKEVLNAINLANQNHIMSPSIEAVKIAESIAKTLKVN